MKRNDYVCVCVFSLHTLSFSLYMSSSVYAAMALCDDRRGRASFLVGGGGATTMLLFLPFLPACFSWLSPKFINLRNVDNGFIDDDLPLPLPALALVRVPLPRWL